MGLRTFIVESVKAAFSPAVNQIAPGEKLLGPREGRFGELHDFLTGADIPPPPPKNAPAKRL